MTRLLALLLLASVLFASPAMAAKALFDDSHAEDAGNADWVIDDNFPTPSPAQSGITPSTPGTYWTGAISSFGVALVKRGYTVTSNTSTITYGNGSNPQDLSNFDVFIVDEPNTLFSAAEVTAILNFVHDGGGLIAISDHSGSDRNNDGYDSPMIWNAVDPTHALFGVHFGVAGDANNDIYSSATVSTNVATSPSDSVTQGADGPVAGLQYASGTTMTLYPSSNPTVRGEVWMNGLSQASLTGVMAASCQYGSGRVFFEGDSSPADDGSARAGNSSIYDGWDVSGDSTIFVNATLWATRRTSTGDTQAPVVSMTSPDGGEDWKAGSAHSITWTATDNVGVTSVDLAYSTNGGTSFPNTIATGLSNTGSYSWTVPNAPGTTLRVRAIARDAAGNAGRDSSAANFTVDLWTINASATTLGTISPFGSVSVVQGASQGFTITPNANCHVYDVEVDYASVGTPTSYTFSAVAANHVIWAGFQVDTRTIVASAGPNGTIGPAGTVTVSYDSTQAFTITPDPGYHVADVLVDGGSVGAVTTYTFSGVTANHTIAASFAVNSFGLTVSTVGGGTVTKYPDLASYPQGSSVTLTAVPGTGWAFSGWSGDTTTTGNPLALLILGAKSVTATFADVAPPSVTVLAPNGGENWSFGAVQQVMWSASDNAAVTGVTLEYSTTGSGGPWTSIASGLANSGTYDWTIPSDASTQAMVRATAVDAAANAASDTSDAVFTISDPSAGVGGGPAVLALSRPAPNPGSGAAILGFSLPKAGSARIEVIDASGRRVAMTSGSFGAGLHSWRWDGRLADGSPAHAGLYFVRLVTPFGNKLQRMVHLD